MRGIPSSHRLSRTDPRKARRYPDRRTPRFRAVRSNRDRRDRFRRDFRDEVASSTVRASFVRRAVLLGRFADPVAWPRPVQLSTSCRLGWLPQPRRAATHSEHRCSTCASSRHVSRRLLQHAHGPRPRFRETWSTTPKEQRDAYGCTRRPAYARPRTADAATSLPHDRALSSLARVRRYQRGTVCQTELAKASRSMPSREGATPPKKTECDPPSSPTRAALPELSSERPASLDTLRCGATLINASSTAGHPPP